MKRPPPVAPSSPGGGVRTSVPTAALPWRDTPGARSTCVGRFSPAAYTLTSARATRQSTESPPPHTRSAPRKAAGNAAADASGSTRRTVTGPAHAGERSGASTRRTHASSASVHVALPTRNVLCAGDNGSAPDQGTKRDDRASRVVTCRAAATMISCTEKTARKAKARILLGLTREGSGAGWRAG